MPVVFCYHPYYPCLSTFWHYHPYFFLQFSVIVFVLVTVIFFLIQGSYHNLSLHTVVQFSVSYMYFLTEQFSSYTSETLIYGNQVNAAAIIVTERIVICVSQVWSWRGASLD